MKMAGFPQTIESNIPWLSLTFPWPISKFPDQKHRNSPSLIGQLWAWLTNVGSKPTLTTFKSEYTLTFMVSLLLFNFHFLIYFKGMSE